MAGNATKGTGQFGGGKSGGKNTGKVSGNASQGVRQFGKGGKTPK